MTTSNTLSHGLDIEPEIILTVAMAVYNADRYLESAIENILSQTFREYELLIIDDGSTDNSINIIKEFAAKYKRIRFIEKERNEGLSSVRNLSIKEALGTYLLMIDADDLFESDTIAKAIDIAEKKNADIVIWDYDTFSGLEPVTNNSKSRLCDLDVSDRFSLLRLPAFMPVRLIRTEYIRSRGWKFPMGFTKQDIPIHWAMMTDPESKIEIIPTILFHYRQQPNATSNRRGRSLFSLAFVMDIVGLQLKSDALYEIYREEYLRSRLTLLHGMYDFISDELKPEAMHKIIDRVDADATSFLKSHQKILSKRVRLFYRMIQGDRLASIQYKAFIKIRKIYRKLR